MSCDTKAVFSPELMVSFRSTRRFSSYLVRAKLYPFEIFVGSRQCRKRRCKICTNVTETDTFSVTGETFQINHERICNDKCLIYSLKCMVLWKHHKDNDRIFQRNESYMQQHLYEHFYSEGHYGFLGNVSISLIDKTDDFQPKKRENYSMRILKALVPLGFNVESAV